MKTREAKQLNAVLSKMTFVSVADKIMPILQSLSELGKICKEADEIELSAIKGLGLEIVGTQVKSDTPELHSQLVKVLDELGNKEVDITLPKLSKSDFALLAKENAGIKAGGLVLISEFMVD